MLQFFFFFFTKNFLFDLLNFEEVWFWDGRGFRRYARFSSFWGYFWALLVLLKSTVSSFVKILKDTFCIAANLRKSFLIWHTTISNLISLGSKVTWDKCYNTLIIRKDVWIRNFFWHSLSFIDIKPLEKFGHGLAVSLRDICTWSAGIHLNPFKAIAYWLWEKKFWGLVGAFLVSTTSIFTKGD